MIKRHHSDTLYLMLQIHSSDPDKESIASVSSEPDIVEVDGCVRSPPRVMTQSKVVTSPSTDCLPTRPMSANYSPPPLKPTSPPTTEGIVFSHSTDKLS